MTGRKSQFLIIEEEPLGNSVRKYWCLYDKCWVDYRNKTEKDETPAISDDGTGRMSDAESNASE